MQHIKPGTVLRHRLGDEVTIARRKEDDSGWWVTDGGGVADVVLDKPDEWFYAAVPAGDVQ